MNCNLITSFTTWKAHHRSNSSDDLLGAISLRYPRGVAASHLADFNTYFLRKVAVDFQLAPRQVLSMVDLLTPEIVICCGMAENRNSLTIESNGKFQTETIETAIDLDHLIKGTNAIQISHDAGNFVCNHLYYSVLKRLKNGNLKSQCIFVHVPVLNDQNLETIVEDFLTLIDRLNARKFLLK
ncbi:pyroglutamyl-peptidase I family protein [Phormidesmis priestleyi]